MTTTTNPLAALFAEADRICNKYQSQEEIEDYGARLDAAFEAVEDTIAHQTITQAITPEVIKSLSFYSLCCLAGYLGIVDPTQVEIQGTITLDAFGNFVSANAEYKAFNGFWV